jgi:hypothetical protein
MFPVKDFIFPGLFLFFQCCFYISGAVFKFILKLVKRILCKQNLKKQQFVMNYGWRVFVNRVLPNRGNKFLLLMQGTGNRPGELGFIPLF